MGIEINDSFFATKLDSLINWSRKYSLFQYPFITSCCGIEYMSTACSHYDIGLYRNSLWNGLPDSNFSIAERRGYFLVSTEFKN